MGNAIVMVGNVKGFGPGHQTDTKVVDDIIIPCIPDVSLISLLYWSCSENATDCHAHACPWFSGT